MKHLAAIATALLVSIASMAWAPAKADHGYPPFIPTICHAQVTGRPTVASIRVTAQSNKQPRGTVAITIARRGGRVMRSAAYRFSGGRRVESTFRQLPRGRYVARFMVADMHLWHGCSASVRFVVR